MALFTIRRTRQGRALTAEPGCAITLVALAAWLESGILQTVLCVDRPRAARRSLQSARPYSLMRCAGIPRAYQFLMAAIIGSPARSAGAKDGSAHAWLFHRCGLACKRRPAVRAAGERSYASPAIHGCATVNTIA